MSLSLSRKTKLITKWTDESISGLSDASTFVVSGSDKEVFIPTSGLPNFSPNFTTIDRNIIKDSFFDDSPIRGYAEITASLTFELAGAEGVDTKPVYHPFLYAALGSVSNVTTAVSDVTVNVPSFTLDGNYITGTFTVDDATGLKVGYFIRVYSGTTTKFIAEITGISASQLEVKIPVTQNATGTTTPTLATGDVVTTGAIYKPEDTLDLPKLYFDLYRQIAGLDKYVKETYGEMTVSELSIPITAGQIVLPTVNLDGSTVDVDDNGGAGYDSPTHSTIDMFPIIARNNSIWLTIGSTIKDAIAEANFTVTNTIYKKMVVGANGPQEVARTSRNCTATMNLYYEDNSLMEALVGDTRFSISAILPTHNISSNSSTLGDTVTIKVPQARLSNAPVTDDSGTYKQDLTIAVELPDASTDSLDKEIAIQVL